VAWGGYQGALLMGHRWFSENVKARLPRLSALGSMVSVTLMFCCVLYGWLLFRLRDGGQLAAAHHALWHFHVGADFLPRLAKMLPYIGLVLAVDTVTFSSAIHFISRAATPGRSPPFTSCSSISCSSSGNWWRTIHLLRILSRHAAQTALAHTLRISSRSKPHCLSPRQGTW